MPRKSVLLILAASVGLCFLLTGCYYGHYGYGHRYYDDYYRYGPAARHHKSYDFNYREHHRAKPPKKIKPGDKAHYRPGRGEGGELRPVPGGKYRNDGQLREVKHSRRNKPMIRTDRPARENRPSAPPPRVQEQRPPRREPAPTVNRPAERPRRESAPPILKREQNSRPAMRSGGQVERRRPR